MTGVTTATHIQEVHLGRVEVYAVR